ncbi:hypothetical protein PR048_027103 [Dryococelus australis]|uniref:Uncharacterized protein n=1 Tax=Dryococelus australis TaxID=614101 RepID=A0ABQ9GEI0_9NEOP|nr:hypothetical protein PR048_027103 [Dryococelus australis]
MPPSWQLRYFDRKFDVKEITPQCYENILLSHTFPLNIFAIDVWKYESMSRESCRMFPLVGGFSRRSPIFPAVAFRRCSILASLHPQDFDVKRAAQISSLIHSMLRNIPLASGEGARVGESAAPDSRVERRMIWWVGFTDLVYNPLTPPPHKRSRRAALWLHCDAGGWRMTRLFPACHPLSSFTPSSSTRLQHPPPPPGGGTWSRRHSHPLMLRIVERNSSFRDTGSRESQSLLRSSLATPTLLPRRGRFCSLFVPRSGCRHKAPCSPVDKTPRLEVYRRHDARPPDIISPPAISRWGHRHGCLSPPPRGRGRGENIRNRCSSVGREPYSGAAVAQWVELPIVWPRAKQRDKDLKVLKVLACVEDLVPIPNLPLWIPPLPERDEMVQCGSAPIAQGQGEPTCNRRVGGSLPGSSAGKSFSSHVAHTCTVNFLSSRPTTWAPYNTTDSHLGRPGFDSRSSHLDFSFPWFTEITPGECWDGYLTKAMADSFPFLPQSLFREQLAPTCNDLVVDPAAGFSVHSIPTPTIGLSYVATSDIVNQQASGWLFSSQYPYTNNWAIVCCD